MPDRPQPGERASVAVPFRSRIALSVTAGLVAGVFAYYHAVAGGTRARDFSQAWFAAQAVLHGQDPYQLIGPGRAFDYPFGFLYPLPAALVAIPVAPLSAPLANAVLLFAGVGCLAWALMARGFDPLLGLLSASVLFAAEAGQWSPLLAAAVVLSPLGVILVAKPTIGAAIFAARPSWWGVGGAIVLSALAFAVQPQWVTAWREAMETRSTYSAPVLFPGGFLVVLALLRWRRPEARLLVALACVPQTTLLYETVPLFLIPRTIREAALLTVASYGVAWWVLRSGATDYAGALAVSGRAITLALYLPATVMGLRRPNEGVVPAWLEQRITTWPGWLRGAPA